MELTEVVSKLKDKFGDKIDVEKITAKLKNEDLSKLDFSEIVAKVKEHIGDLDGDGKVESTLEELKGKAESVLGNIFHKR